MCRKISNYDKLREQLKLAEKENIEIIEIDSGWFRDVFTVRRILRNYDEKVGDAL